MIDRKYQILIVGGSSSIGIELLNTLQATDFGLIATYRSFIPKNVPESIQWLHLDLESSESIANFLASIRHFGVDIAIFLIGKTNAKELSDCTFNTIDFYIQTYVTNYTYLIKELVYSVCLDVDFTYLFLNISSRSATKGSYDFLYAQAKAAIHSLFLSLNKQLNNVAFFNLVLGLIENSGMYNDMSRQLQENHRKRAGGKLLEIKQVSTAIELLIDDLKQGKLCKASNNTIFLGPDYA